MKDFVGNQLSVGDKVAFLGTGYRHMLLGTVIGFTAKMIRIEHFPGIGTESLLREPGYVSKLFQSPV